QGEGRWVYLGWNVSERLVLLRLASALDREDVSREPKPPGFEEAAAAQGEDISVPSDDGPEGNFSTLEGHDSIRLELEERAVLSAPSTPKLRRASRVSRKGTSNGERRAPEEDKHGNDPVAFCHSHRISLCRAALAQAEGRIAEAWGHDTVRRI